MVMTKAFKAYFSTFLGRFNEGTRKDGNLFNFLEHRNPFAEAIIVHENIKLLASLETKHNIEDHKSRVSS